MDRVLSKKGKEGYMGNVISFKKAQYKKEMEEELRERKARIEESRNH